MILLATEKQQAQARELGVQKFRTLSASQVQKLIDALANGNVTILMRHGEQQKSAEVSKLSNAALQKIEMMRHPNNLQDPLTQQSQVELTGLAIALDFIQEQTGKQFIVETSENKRASQAAAAIAHALNADLSYMPMWNCVNYSLQMSNEALLALIPDGTLPWEKELVNTIIAAEVYEQITRSVLNALSCQQSQIKLIITHTQQLNAAAKLYSLPLARLGNFGFLLIQEEPQVFSQGLFQD